LAAQVTHRLAFGDFVIAAQIDGHSIRRGVYVSISSNLHEPVATIIPIDGESDSFRSSLSMTGWLRDDHLTPDELEFAEYVRAILRARR
jgi:antitoxin (DNA-binding transcriptional repressor) of toxin-antitoxin stability system